MLGTILAVESLMKGDKIMPSQAGRQRPVLAVRATFEESRLAAACLATAYEQAVPVRRRTAPAPRPSTSHDQAGHSRDDPDLALRVIAHVGGRLRDAYDLHALPDARPRGLHSGAPGDGQS